MFSLDPLALALDRFRAGWEARVGETIARQIAGDIEDLRASGILDRAARRGDLLPSGVSLTDALGRPFDLRPLVARQPVILTFYRGGWCPYCSLELRAYQAHLPEICAFGAALVAISPETPGNARTAAEKNNLDFTVLSDAGSHFAAALGIRFTLSEALRPLYAAAGHALPDRNGADSWALPMPATFVVGRGGVIAASFVEPDYRRRLDPREAIAALGGIAAPAA